MIYGALKLRPLISPRPADTLQITGRDELLDELLTGWRSGGWSCHYGLNPFLSTPNLPGKTEKPFIKMLALVERKEQSMISQSLDWTNSAAIMMRFAKSFLLVLPLLVWFSHVNADEYNYTNEIKKGFVARANTIIHEKILKGTKIDVNDLSEIESWTEREFFVKKESPENNGFIAMRTEKDFLVVWIHHQTPKSCGNEEKISKIIEKMTTGFLSPAFQIKESNSYSDSSKEDMEFLQKLDKEIGSGKKKLAERLFFIEESKTVKSDGTIQCSYHRLQDGQDDQGFADPTTLVMTNQDVFIAMEYLKLRRGKHNEIVYQGLDACAKGKATNLAPKGLEMTKRFANACIWPENKKKDPKIMDQSQAKIIENPKP